MHGREDEGDVLLSTENGSVLSSISLSTHAHRGARMSQCRARLKARWGRRVAVLLSTDKGMFPHAHDGVMRRGKVIEIQSHTPNHGVPGPHK